MKTTDDKKYFKRQADFLSGCFFSNPYHCISAHRRGIIASATNRMRPDFPDFKSLLIDLTGSFPVYIPEIDPDLSAIGKGYHCSQCGE